MKRFLRTLLLFLPAVLCMIAIFAFSSQTATTSSNTSGGLIETILSMLPIGFHEMAPDERETLVQACQFITRKGAHFSIFALLGASYYLPSSHFIHSRRMPAAVAFLLAALYAASDELHQKFVPGRSAEVRDVLIDCAGAALGVLVCYAAISFLDKRKRNQNKKSGDA